MEADKLMLGNLFVEKNTFREGLGEVIQVIGLKELFTENIVPKHMGKVTENFEVEFSGDFPEGWQAVPIKITDGILAQLGIKKDGPKRYVNGFRLFYNEWHGFHYWDYRISKEEPIKIEYVHELQNIYFYLKGEHLKHKLTGMIIPL